MPNTFFSVTHKGQTKLAVEYQEIFISLKQSFIQTLDKKYFFTTTKKDMQSLYSKLKNAQIKNTGNIEKETLFIIQSGKKTDKRLNSIWNLSSFVYIVENFVDKKMALPFRLPLTAPRDLVIEIEQHNDLFSEYGKYIRLLIGEGHMSLIDKERKELHRFDISQEDLQSFIRILRQKKFMWLQDSENYATIKTVVTWGENRLEKNITIPSLYSYIEKQKQLYSFPSKVVDNLQIEILYETDTPKTRKEIYLSSTTGYLYILDTKGNRTQYQLDMTPRIIYKLLTTISKNQKLGTAANMIVNWDNSRVEKKITLTSFNAIEKKIHELLKKQQVK
ncbi:hypothetical protein [Candidatus Uabimicrobium sp. HlEnr_7]|uniref:hypothetical protein n=1 Tax=Candidatus Uabimicrobium helgolandensis TaxID=3095367 RepID=UPI003555E2C9